MGRSFLVGLWTVEPDLNAISRDGEVVHLEPKAIEVLLRLAETPGQTVSKDGIIGSVWPDTFVSDDVLSRAIYELRKSFHDDPHHPQYIQTISKRGYRLIASVKPIGDDQPEPGAINGPILRELDLPRVVEVGSATEPRFRLFRSRHVRLLALVLPILVIASLLTAIFSRKRSDSSDLPHIGSIAVLPLANVSGDPQQEYFAEGMTEELITNIAKIRGLRVISRTSVMQYRHAAKPLPTIARELKVDAIVEGSVLRSGNRVRVTANLLYAPTDRHLWANSYERDLKDVLALQGELARDIAQQVRIKVTPDEQASLNPAHTVNPEAFEAYLRGTYALTRIWGPAIPGVEHFRHAVNVDPTYARAYVGLCLAYVQMGFGYGPLSSTEAFAESKKAALAALKLDPGIGDAHACLGWVEAFHEWDWPAAESEFRRAIELSPNSVQGHRLYSRYLSAMRRHTEAIRESEFARTLDPASPAVLYGVGSAYWYARQYERAAILADTIEKIDPNFPGASYLWGLVHFKTGHYDKAILRFQKAVDLSGDAFPVWYIAILGSAYACAGKRAEALRILDQLQSASKTQYVSPYLMAILYSSLGETQRSLDYLDKAYAERNAMIATLQIEQLFDFVRSDPQFQLLIRRINFPH